MIGLKSRKTAVLAVFAIVLVAAVAILVYPAFAAEPEIQSKHVLAKARGFAFQRIDNETIKQYPANLTLTFELGKRKNTTIPVLHVTGSLDVKGATYTIEDGTGMINTQRHVTVIRCTGVDQSGNRITLDVASRYFWWGGNLYTFRAKALLSTTDKPMLLLLRGAAKVY